MGNDPYFRKAGSIAVRPADCPRPASRSAPATGVAATCCSVRSLYMASRPLSAGSALLIERAGAESSRPRWCAAAAARSRRRRWRFTTAVGRGEASPSVLLQVEASAAEPAAAVLLSCGLEAPCRRPARSSWPRTLGAVCPAARRRTPPVWQARMGRAMERGYRPGHGHIARSAPAFAAVRPEIAPRPPPAGREPMPPPLRLFRRQHCSALAARSQAAAWLRVWLGRCCSLMINLQAETRGAHVCFE